MKIKVNLPPKTGYNFKESDGATIKASSWKGLFKKVARYRALNKLAPGNPEQEVTAQMCAREPAMCYEEGSVTREQTKKASLKGRVLAWLSHRHRNPGALVFTSDPNIVEVRRAVCAACPLNQPLSEGCSSCKKVVLELRKSILGNRFLDGRLNGCSVIGQDNPTAVYLEDQTLADPNLPAHCWRKRTL